MAEATITAGARTSAPRTLAIPEEAKRRVRPSTARILLLECATELLRTARMPDFVLPTLAFPAMFYVFFGVVFAKSSVMMPSYLLATYGTFGIMGPALFGFGVSLAIERGQGWHTLKSATPAPAYGTLLAKLVMCLVFASLIVIVLFTLGATVGHVTLPRVTWLVMGLALVFGTIPFCAMGLALGSLLKPQSAPAVVNLLYLPMAFLSGLWIPIKVLPQALQTFATFLPPYHLSQLALSPLGLSQGTDPLVHVLALAATTLIFGAVAVFGLRRGED